MKLVVGVDSLREFAAWQAQHKKTYKGVQANVIFTRNQPKQALEILETGGSAYRIIKGIMCCRQRILGFEPVETMQGRKCLIYTDTEIVKTRPLPRKAFQGWRYLKEDAAPQDVGIYNLHETSDDADDFEAELVAMGVI